MATKQIPREILSILRQFEVAGQLSVPKEISDVREREPRAGVRIYRLIFDGVEYFAIIDNNANDDTATLLEYIRLDRPDIHGEFLKNPHENSFTTYGIRHKFRDTYLFKTIPTTKRLDIELARRYPDLSRSTLQKYIKAGYVSVKGHVVTKAKVDVSEHDDIALEPPKRDDFSERELPILYVDDNVIVANKPAGVLTHSKGVMNDEFTVADFFRRYTTDALHTNRPGIVHRLDRDTSGVIIGARTSDAAVVLKKQFAKRTVHKQYLAIVKGIPKEMKARVELPIGRHPSAPSTFRVDPSGKHAVTTYEVLAIKDDYALVLLKPETGRTHQLRVHLQYLNTPIVGDRVYGNGKMGDRLYLHAYKLEITVPISQRKEFTAPIPKEFKDFFPGELDG